MLSRLVPHFTPSGLGKPHPCMSVLLRTNLSGRKRSITFNPIVFSHTVYRLAFLWWGINLKSICLCLLFWCVVEKPQTQQSTNTEKSSDLNHAKGHAKERSGRKCRKGKHTQTAVEETPAPDKEEKMEVSSQTQESLRWEGVLDDPIAEAERLEVYKANRRKRYTAFKQTVLENAKVALGSESGTNKLGRACKAGSATIM